MTMPATLPIDSEAGIPATSTQRGGFVPRTRPRIRSVHLGMHDFAQRAGGLDRYVNDLVRRLDASGNPAIAIVGSIDGTGLRSCKPSASRLRPYGPASGNLASRYLAIRRTFSREIIAGYDVVASHFAMTAFPLRRQLRDMPHVVHFHGPWAEESHAEGSGSLKVLIKRHVERSVYTTADRIICLSRAFADLVVRDFGIDRSIVRVVPGGVDFDRFDCGISRADARAALGWPCDRRIVIAVRRLTRRMGLEKLIDATAIVARRHPDVLMLIFGIGPLAGSLASRVKEIGVSDHCCICGFISDASLPLAYRGADLSVVPSIKLEGFGLTAAESLAAGTPVIVAPVGGLPELVAGLSPSLVLPDLSVESLARRISEALAEPSSVPTADACRVHARANFEWQSVADRVLDVYAEAVDSG